MFNVGDKVKCIIDDEVYYGDVLKMISPLKYLVEVEDEEEENTFEREFYDDELTLAKVVSLNKQDLKKLIRYEAKISDYVDLDEESFVYEFGNQYLPTIEDLLVFFINISNNFEDHSDYFIDWCTEMYLGKLGNAYDLKHYKTIWDNMMKSLDLDQFDDDAMIGFVFNYFDGSFDIISMMGVLEENIVSIRNDLRQYLDTKNLVVEERYFPYDLKYKYIISYDEKIQHQELNEIQLYLYRKYVEELAKEGNVKVREILGYCYYGGNQAYETDWFKSRDIFEGLFKETGNPQYANTLGYIYYYGRCNEGEPEYEKAYTYFSYGSLNGYYESTYKLADMMMHGYGVPKNRQMAERLYQQVYDDNIQYIESEHFDSKFADAALRMGGSLEDVQDEDEFDLDAYYYYLQAEYAINKRMKYNFYGDQVVYNSIQKAINRMKENIEEDIHSKTATFTFYQLGLIGNNHYPVRVKVKHLKSGIRFTTSRVFKRNEKHRKYLFTVPECSYCNLVDEIVFKANHIEKLEINNQSDEFIFNECEYKKDGIYYYYDGRLTAKMEGYSLIWKCPKKNMKSSREYHFVTIRFNHFSRSYDYLCDDMSVKIGDLVVVDSYNGEQVVEVIDAFNRTENELDFPIERYKKVLRKIERED